ncbi:ClpP Protease subunit of ATP-dependent Clp proteases [uncultured Caudovirales phage]|uniref:ClpP Protease subunit of ATP-dependent Clp proteases n=1 Tax=uncultured Caudovirales phage TaxID=2100421 RepID=A0A6J5S320_9CAUD|nr:head maturation protease [uncultured Caudovirales phage]CAB4202248.1 ClpP Protease subunit of ATP-dependent Clp proteases [uncultured Caudovirales phage]
MLADNNQLELYLYGTIGSWNINVDSLREAMRGYENTPIIVYLSSTGGYFEDGLPIYNLLKQHKAEVTVVVMGFALSMASIVMLAGDKVKACNNAIMMIHRAEGCACGDAEDLRKAADVCEIHEEAVIPIYVAKTGLTADEVFAMMEEETWFNADDALAIGLIDEIIDPVDMSAIDAVLPPDDIKAATKNFKNCPPDLLANELSEKSLLLKILNAVVGEKPAPIIPLLPTNDIDMTAEELKALFAENNKVLLDNLAMLKKPVEEKTIDETAVKMAALEATITLQAAEIATLKVPTPFTVVEENAGGNDETSDSEKW